MSAGIGLAGVPLPSRLSSAASGSCFLTFCCEMISSKRGFAGLKLP